MSSRPIVEFNKGMPSDDILGRDLMATTLTELDGATASTFDYLNYGEEGGSLRFRTAVCDFINASYPEIRAGTRRAFTPAEFSQTAGNSHAMSVISTLLLAGRPATVLCDAATYPFAVLTMKDHKAHVVGVPLKDGQTDVEAMEAEVDKAAAAGRPVAYAYVIPSFHNPTGANMTVATRRALVALAQRRDFFIAADDVYQLLAFEGDAPTALSFFEQDTEPAACRVLSLGTFSKIFAPALRLGWIQTRNADFIERLRRFGEQISGGTFSGFAGRIGELMLESGRQRELLQRVRRRLQSKCRLMCARLTAELGPLVRFEEPAGGYFVWVELAEAVAVAPTALRAECKAEQPLAVDFFPGPVFCPDGERHVRHLRLSYALFDEAAIEAGVAVLAAVIKRHVQT